MTKRIFSSICTVAFIVLLATCVLIFGVLYKHFSDSQMEFLRAQIDMVEKGINSAGTEYLESLDYDNYRITWVAPDGKVIYDSHYESAQMENHSGRDEIKEAFLYGSGESQRFSETFTERYIYHAEKIADGSVVRVSTSTKSVWFLLRNIAVPIVAVFAFAAGISVFFAKKISKAVVEPLNEIDLDAPLEGKAYDELSPFLRRIETQQGELREQAEKLRKSKNEFDTVLESMNEGVILINSNDKIISINRSAERILSAKEDPCGNDIFTLCHHIAMQEAVSEAKKGIASERNIELCEKMWRLEANPVFAEDSVYGMVLLFFDITEKESIEQMRREFTANVSHELKTPIHSITGYSELMASGIMKTEDYVSCAKRIHSEAKRMSKLIEDIISLSHLDENVRDMKTEATDLFTAAEGVVKNLETTAKLAGIEVSLSGKHAVINAIPELIEEIIFNLCDNAIKYNRPGGKVEVSVRKTPSEVVLAVSDNGIGIPAEHRERIFERFYRVDKSHSKEVGGTGLGLSIVKHAAKVHGAKIEVESYVGKGTKIFVRFPVS